MLVQIWHQPDHAPVGDLNRCIFYLTQDWNGLGGAIILVEFVRMSGGQNVGTIRVTSEPLFMSGLGHLARYCIIIICG